jgi:hypothetical protein
MKRMIPARVLAIALFAAPITAFAQTETPTRVDNIWNGRDHQPTEAQVRQKERAAGIAPTPSRDAAEAATLNQINRQLLE